MIAHTDFSTLADLPRRLAFAFVRMVRNRRALRDLDAARLDDCGISREAMEKAVDWRFWQRLDDAPATSRRASVGRTHAHLESSASVSAA